MKHCPNKLTLILAITVVLTACVGSQSASNPTHVPTATKLPPTPTIEPSPTPDPVLLQQRQSIYISLESNQEVAARNVLLVTELVLELSDWVFLETDGSYAPLANDSAATVYIQVDGQRVSNESRTDWRGSRVPLPHSFNAIGTLYLEAGAHTVELIAESLAGPFTVATSSNLSIFVHPSDSISEAMLDTEAGPFQYTTLGNSGPDLPHDPLVSITADVRTPTIALASATARTSAHDGDPMFGIYLDGQHPGNVSSLWTVNDTCACAEPEGPFFTQALLTGGSQNSVISLDATEFAWRGSEDPAIYVVPPSPMLVVLNGGMQIVGKADSLLPSHDDEIGTVWNGSCIGSSVGWPDGCPEMGTDVLLASQTINVPDNHSGIVMFVAKSRVQGDETDAGGTIQLWLTIDGVQRGSIGLQEIKAPSGDSQRTLAASYLAAGNEKLAPGMHTIELHGRAEGSFIHIVILQDIPLVWFD